MVKQKAKEIKKIKETKDKKMKTKTTTLPRNKIPRRK
jgi:hypothetical protein